MSHPLLEKAEEQIFSVTEYLDLVNELLGPLRVSVEGEITDLKILPQWVFFSLKDAESGSLLRCGLHSGAYRRLGINIEEGMAVKVLGYGKLSPKTGNFGFWVSKIEPIGEGALRRAYELLVKKLQEEGLFTRKRDIPEFISHIGVISSKNGVVVQDLMQNLQPLGIKVDFLHSGVEGADSAGEILSAIKHFTAMKNGPQVLVLIRGGGSLESLQGFNNESVVRALFAAPMPVLVGIGHDVDAPIATLVADWSASTPTAVAHVINDSWASLTDRVPALAYDMHTAFSRRLREVEHKAEMSLHTMQHSITRILARFKRYEDSLSAARSRISTRLKNIHVQCKNTLQRVTNSVPRRLTDISRRISDHERLLKVSDPHNVLARGYGLVYGPDGRLVRRVGQVEQGEMVKIRLNDGSFESTVTKKEFKH